ncbi:MAG: hypothetical protein JST30_01490 [Armatimonadetes bacterium]|nr:hypothetical protein [Armatimonadota bacterium]
MKESTIIALAMVASAMLFASGCSSTSVASPPATGNKQGAQTLVSVDYSQSTEQIRSHLMSMSFDIGTNFDPQVDSLRLFRFGHNVEEVWDSNQQSSVDLDDDAFALILAQNLKKSDPIGGTDYATMLDAMADAAETTPEPLVRVVVCGDGWNDFKGDREHDTRYRAAAERLAKNPKVKLVRLWGVSTGTREEIRSVLKPLGARVQVMSLDQNPLAP